MYEQWHVPLSVAERGERDGEDVQAVIQVLPELALADRHSGIAVRRRDDADIHLDRIRSADALELVLLKHAEKFDLNVERNFADLIQENRPSVGQLKAAQAPADRPRKCPLLVAEQFGLDQARG